MTILRTTSGVLQDRRFVELVSNQARKIQESVSKKSPSMQTGKMLHGESRVSRSVRTLAPHSSTFFLPWGPAIKVPMYLNHHRSIQLDRTYSNRSEAAKVLRRTVLSNDKSRDDFEDHLPVALGVT
jgi:hypothetical protein